MEQYNFTIREKIRLSKLIKDPCERKEFLLEKKSHWQSMFSEEHVKRLGDQFDPYIDDAQEEYNRIAGLPEQKETKGEFIYKKLFQYGFFKLDQVQVLDDKGRKDLLDIVVLGSLPYRIALFDYLGFLKYLGEKHFSSQQKMAKEIANWFGVDKTGRSVRGNINSLVNPNDRYTAHLHTEQVKKDYKGLK